MELNVIITIERYLQLPWGLRRALFRNPNDADVFEVCCHFLADKNDEYLPFDDAIQTLWNATDSDIETIVNALKTQLEDMSKTALPLASEKKS